MKKLVSLALAAAGLSTAMYAAEGAGPRSVPHLDHVFVVMMENHGYAQIVNNPNAPFINAYAASANVATNYFAVAHPSLTNYLEIVGGSNFGVHDDNNPDWHNASCQPNIVTRVPNTEASSNAICPISGSGKDAATPAIDYTNETSGPPGVLNLDGKRLFPSRWTQGITIADQLVSKGMTWKSYQESLPPSGPDGVNNADGVYSNLNAPTGYNLVALYAAKHDPFVYFANVQAGTNPYLSYSQIVPFVGTGGLWDDLSNGNVPNFSFIAPNQCNDQHGRGNAGPACAYDPSDNGTQVGLNPLLIQAGDTAVQNIVTAIKNSPAWNQGNNVIVVIWDENDYSVSPITNQVLAIVDTNYGPHGVQSKQFYDHFSLLKTIEAGFGLPCLNNACDSQSPAMNDLFGGR